MTDRNEPDEFTDDYGTWSRRELTAAGFNVNDAYERPEPDCDCDACLYFYEARAALSRASGQKKGNSDGE